MGEREDTDPSHRTSGTQPGLGPPSSGSVRTVPPIARGPERASAPPVDFDALNAALGDPKTEEILRPSQANAVPARTGESQGRSSATYASSRPHTLPARRISTETPDIPAVIVAGEDTVPTAPPKMTVPVGTPPPMLAARPAPPSGSHAHASSQPLPAAHPAYGPPPFVPPGAASNLTMRMPERPRRPKTPTIVVRARGPSTTQKFVAFGVMLGIITGVGVAVLVVNPGWLGLAPRTAAPTATARPTATVTIAATAAPTITVQLPATSTAEPSPSASATTSARPPKVTPRPHPNGPAVRTNPF